MNRYKFWNNTAGWFSFLIAFVVYLLTLEPSMSLWDCGEFIASSYKLQVGHPPGAPFFLMLTKVFSLLTVNPANVAIMVNAFSALASAFTVLFLFWTITHLVGKIVAAGIDKSCLNDLLVLGSGFVGAMAFTFSDSFWFSAVEAEVYATSSLFTAAAFWAVLKWEQNADKPYANRWLVLIAYLIGLSIGVHLLNLLAIPAIVLVYYYRMYQPTAKRFLIALLGSFTLLAFMQYGVIPGVVKLASKVELLFVNRFGLPFNSGILFYLVVICLMVIWGIWYSRRKGKVLLNTILLSFAMVLLGYSTYAMIVVRSNADTPLNENSPKNVFSLLYYLNREQYGNRPLFQGQYFNAPVLYVKQGKPQYIPLGNKYIVADYDYEYVYDSRFTTLFPRMYSADAGHVRVYKEWANIKGIPLTVKKDEKQVIEYKPTFIDNLEFFIKYQVGYMYFRYFLWNFAGKQNDLQTNGGILYGNWISGIPLLDTYFYGPQNKLPTYLKENKGHNTYYLFPLLLGILGMVYQFRKNRPGFKVVLWLFIMTGLAIVVYLNQTPLQPRERDYAYAGSYYAFAVWIGIGVAGLAGLLKRFLKSKISVIAAVSLSVMLVPALMASENWDDHDRSNRYIGRDMAFNYLNSCAPNAILFTSGDNDTFPLWYLQEVEGVRTDVRVVNLMLLGTDWYIDQMQRQYIGAEPLPMTLTYKKIRNGKRDVVYFFEKTKDYIDIRDALKFVASDSVSTKYVSEPGDTLDYFPSRNFSFIVDSANVVNNGTIDSSDFAVAENVINFRISKSYLLKGELAVMDILAQNNWKRPVYYTSPSYNGTLGLQKYLRLEGFTYRLTPIPNEKAEQLETGSVASKIMYQNVMDTFRWKSITNPAVLIDNHYLKVFSFMRLRLNLSRLAKQLALENKNDSAKKVLELCLTLTATKRVPSDFNSFKLAETCYLAGATEQGDKVLMDFGRQCVEELRFYHALPAHLSNLTKQERSIARGSLERIRTVAKDNGRENVIRGLLAFDKQLSN